MFLAIGCGAYEAAIFLMVAHAFFKALLFLGAGSVIHGLDDEQDLKRMGNLRRYMPITFVTFAIGWLAIAAVPPLSGFWAKGDVLENAFAAHPALWVVGLVTAALTAYYMSRLTGLGLLRHRPVVAEGPRSTPPALDDARHPTTPTEPIDQPHESPPVMTIPLVHPGLLRRGGRGPWPSSNWHVLAAQLGRPGVRVQPLRRPPEHRHPSGYWPSPTQSSPSSAWPSASGCG